MHKIFVFNSSYMLWLLCCVARYDCSVECLLSDPAFLTEATNQHPLITGGIGKQLRYSEVQ